MNISIRRSNKECLNDVIGDEAGNLVGVFMRVGICFLYIEMVVLRCLFGNDFLFNNVVFEKVEKSSMSESQFKFE